MAYKKNVSVKEAVAKGKTMLMLPRILLIFGLFFCMFLFWIFFTAYGNITPQSAGLIYKIGAVALFSVIPLIVLPYWFWSKRTTKWKLWAFENVDDAHELDFAGRSAALFAKYGSVMDRIQIQTQAERQQWTALQDRLKKPYVFEDDRQVPIQTVIYFSTANRLLYIFLYLIFAGGMLAVAFMALKETQQRVLACTGITLLIGFLIFPYVRDLVKHMPQLILNDKGIETVESGFNSWDTIWNEEVKVGRQERRTVWLLLYTHATGMVRLNISELDTDHATLYHLLKVYKGRYNANYQ
jgi:hypothetical protein